MNYEDYYFNAPIELYRDFVGNKSKCLSDIVAYIAAGYDDMDEAQEAMNTNFNYPQEALNRGMKLRNKIQSKVEFSITHKLYWDYHNNTKSELDCLVLLAYLSLKSMIGYRRFFKTSNDVMLMRMAGYANKKEFNEYVSNNNVAGKKWSDAWIVDYQKNPRKCSMLRKELQHRFHNFYYYSQKGMRGFVYMFCDDKREVCETMLVEYVIERQSRYAVQDRIMREARERVKAARLATPPKTG